MKSTPRTLESGAGTPAPSGADGTAVYPHSLLSDRPGPDFEAIKTRQQAAWASGDYGQVGTRLQIVGESLCEAVDLLATERVLDVAAGNGNASLAAARRFADVISTDRVPSLLDEGRRRAEADQLPMTFQVADAESLPFPDRSFDVVLSTFGVMFAPDQERAARELLRVTRQGGRIGLANWTPGGFVGRMFDVVREFAPPPPGIRSPMEWGTETRLVELFGPEATDIRTERKTYNFRYRSAEHWVSFFRAYYGPMLKAFAALDEAGQQRLHDALIQLVGKGRGNGWPVVIPSDYLEVVITK
jgi:ubiquinone/menaquinone biosynthesis C-methylase UbiE